MGGKRGCYLGIKEKKERWEIHIFSGVQSNSVIGVRSNAIHHWLKKSAVQFIKLLHHITVTLVWQKRAFINDVTQVGEGGMYLCDLIYVMDSMFYH